MLHLNIYNAYGHTKESGSCRAGYSTVIGVCSPSFRLLQALALWLELTWALFVFVGVLSAVHPLWQQHKS